jgi:trehalose 6-phosphate synthase
MARAIATAISMPLIERRLRWEAMMKKLRSSTIQQWFGDFVDALQETQVERDVSEALIAEPVLWPPRPANLNARYH